jgi:hypothetical protein
VEFVPDWGKICCPEPDAFQIRFDFDLDSYEMFADIHHFSVLAQGGAVTGITSTVTGTTVASDASVSIYFGAYDS